MRYNFLLLLFGFKCTKAVLVVATLQKKTKDKLPIYVSYQENKILNNISGINNRDNDSFPIFMLTLPRKPIDPMLAGIIRI
jgi:hypothetical protein